MENEEMISDEELREKAQVLYDNISDFRPKTSLRYIEKFLKQIRDQAFKEGREKGLRECLEILRLRMGGLHINTIFYEGAFKDIEDLLSQPPQE